MWSKDWTPAFKRYQLRVMGAMAIYVVVLFTAVWLFKHHPPTGLWRYLVAVAPALPLVGLLVSMGLFLKEEDDEFQRAQMIEQMLWGTGATLVIASVWGFLESFGLAPHIEAYWGVVIWCSAFGLARCVLWRRYS